MRTVIPNPVLQRDESQTDGSATGTLSEQIGKPFESEEIQAVEQSPTAFQKFAEQLPEIHWGVWVAIGLFVFLLVFRRLFRMYRLHIWRQKMASEQEVFRPITTRLKSSETDAALEHETSEAENTENSNTEKVVGDDDFGAAVADFAPPQTSTVVVAPEKKVVEPVENRPSNFDQMKSSEALAATRKEVELLNQRLAHLTETLSSVEGVREELSQTVADLKERLLAERTERESARSEAKRSLEVIEQLKQQLSDSKVAKTGLHEKIEGLQQENAKLQTSNELFQNNWVEKSSLVLKEAEVDSLRAEIANLRQQVADASPQELIEDNESLRLALRTAQNSKEKLKGKLRRTLAKLEELASRESQQASDTGRFSAETPTKVTAK